MQVVKNKSLLTKIGCACCNAGSTIASLGCMAIMSTTTAISGAVAIGSMAASTSFNKFPATLLNLIGRFNFYNKFLTTTALILALHFGSTARLKFSSYRFYFTATF